ncbi:MAG: Rpn family recombination-promoting nuclease/putative transposase, partial [Treponema sp.]|nr:Rpn family recombination-promoting nuclease/putative transposase [Treponema sp.]
SMTYYIEKWENLPITNDYIFCKIFEDAELCKEMIEILLDIKIDHVEFPESQKHLKSSFLSKSIRLDVFVQDEERVFDVEIQVASRPDLALRTRYYHSNMDTCLMQSGMVYSDLKESYVIFLCLFDPIGKGLPMYDFATVEKNHPDIILNDKRHTVLYNILEFEKLEKSEKKFFLECLAKQNAHSDFSKKVLDRFTSVKYDTNWRKEYMTYEMKMLEREREAWAKSREIALAEGISVGLAEGIQQGSHTRNIEIAKQMLLKNFSQNDICDITGLSIDEIEALREK